MLSGVDSLDEVGPEVAGWAGSGLSVPMPSVEGLSVLSEGVEPTLRVDHLAGMGSAGVFVCEAKACISSKFSCAVAKACWVARFALVVGFVEDGARNFGVVGP